MSQVGSFLDEGEPPILFTFGSSLAWIAKDFYRVSVEAAQKLGKRRRKRVMRLTKCFYPNAVVLNIPQLIGIATIRPFNKCLHLG